MSLYTISKKLKYVGLILGISLLLLEAKSLTSTSRKNQTLGYKKSEIISVDSSNGKEHDFQVVLSKGQILSHHFYIQNSTSGSLHFLKCVSSRPCCSRIGPLPSEISPGAILEIPTY